MPSCTKFNYASQARSALPRSAPSLRRHAADSLDPKGAYHCSTCRRWHLTSAPRIQTPPWITRHTHA